MSQATASPVASTGPERKVALPRLLPPPGAGRHDLDAHLGLHGPVPYRGRDRVLIGEVKAAGLTGRGGASFPTYRKLEAVAAGSGSTIVVGNAAESEPASHKDEALLRLAPHLPLDGLQLAAEAVGARRVVLYIRRDLMQSTRIEAQIAERNARRLDRVAIEVSPAPARFIAGQESALASRVSGGLALPTLSPPRVFERGVDGRPTLVQNVETLAHMALIARYGPDWFRSAGTREEPGTMLCTLRQADRSASVAEVPLGTPLSRLLNLGKDTPGPQAVLAGGYHGAWLPIAYASRLVLLNTDLRRLGASTGAGIFAALPANRCGLIETARVARYLALESAGQCGPCLNGLPRIANALAELAGATGKRPRSGIAGDLERWAGLVDGRGACHHPDNTTRFVRSALRMFGPEISQHARGDCSATSHEPFLPIPAGPSDNADWS
jgi:NADH:ubiquinone oxidoreductase subunit F (NADH-binding)